MQASVTEAGIVSLAGCHTIIIIVVGLYLAYIMTMMIITTILKLLVQRYIFASLIDAAEYGIAIYANTLTTGSNCRPAGPIAYNSRINIIIVIIIMTK